MFRASWFATAFLAAIAFSVSPPCCVSIGSPAESAPDTKGVLLRLPSDTLWISVDDQEMPFVLTNLDQRFEANALIEFLRAFVVQRSRRNESLNMVMEWRTKRVVDGEDAFNDFLKTMTAEYKVSIVILPLPTGHNPNTEIERFSDEFAQRKTSVPSKRQRTTR